MKNIHNMNIFNTSEEEALKLTLFYKDDQETSEAITYELV